MFTGAPGFEGIVGRAGAPGRTGFTGFTGASGLKGVVGARGLDGFTGSSGTPGLTGRQGLCQLATAALLSTARCMMLFACRKYSLTELNFVLQISVFVYERQEGYHLHSSQGFSIGKPEKPKVAWSSSVTFVKLSNLHTAVQAVIAGTSVKNWMILLEQSFTTGIHLLTATAVEMLLPIDHQA